MTINVVAALYAAVAEIIAAAVLVNRIACAGLSLFLRGVSRYVSKLL